MKTTTHEEFIQAVRALAIARIEPGTEQRRLLDAKVVYGTGAIRGARGVTFYAAWKSGETKDFIEVCASGEESVVQLAGTTIHELAHVLAGPGTGHGPQWKAAARTLPKTRGAHRLVRQSRKRTAAERMARGEAPAFIRKKKKGGR